MRADLYPLQMLLLTISGWVNRHQQDLIAYLVEENRVLKEQLNGRKLRLTDDQRRRLAAKAKRLGRQALNRVATMVTPDTLMRWHRRLIALKWTYEAKRVGRPGLMKTIAALIVRMAQANSRWGHTSSGTSTATRSAIWCARSRPRREPSAKRISEGHWVACIRAEGYSR